VTDIADEHGVGDQEAVRHVAAGVLVDDDADRLQTGDNRRPQPIPAAGRARDLFDRA
jgi:hypothetical protein